MSIDEALDASERGLKLCIDSQEYRSLPWLRYQKASACTGLATRNKEEPSADKGYDALSETRGGQVWPALRFVLL